ncbi:MAG TPA: permease prefix domain 1-containing protein [Planctomycetaceae bacterium]|jgi:hypothetical protein|nr:permease prefix domain 1-containing protein [Planctomycetaceae bacterium]
MSEQEFDLYLKLLARCLRLTSGQREQIADELRDHLEERLEELARAGVPREKAVVQALDEFGDAAVLAAHFTTIARLKRRRFLMRLSLGSVGALTAGLLIAFAFWPDNRAVRGPERIVAQEKPKAEMPKGEKPKAEKPKAEKRPRHGSGVTQRPSGSQNVALPAAAVPVLPSGLDHPLSSDVVQRSKVETRIVEALSQQVGFFIEPQSLKDALDFIAARYQIPIMIDVKAIEDANVDMSAEVRGNAPGIALCDLLDLLLGQLSAPLGYHIQHGVLMISTIDKINDHLETIVYDCRDLVSVASLEAPLAADQRQVDLGSQGPVTASIGPAQNASSKKASDQVARRPPFIQMVISATGTDVWDEGASISELGGLLIVRQNPRVQERIKRLLASIRLMRKEGAFASLQDHSDLEAKKHAADQSVLITRLNQLEHEVQLLRTQQAASPRTWTPSEPAK